MLIIRRFNCIDAASGIVAVSQWPSGAQVERELLCSTISRAVEVHCSAWTGIDTKMTIAFSCRNILWCSVAAGVCSRQRGWWTAEIRFEDSQRPCNVSAFFT